MESQFNLFLEIDVKLELIQVDCDRFLDVFGHIRPDSKDALIENFQISRKNMDGLNRQLLQHRGILSPIVL